MLFIRPAALAAVLSVTASGLALGSPTRHDHRRQRRLGSQVSLHVSRHNVLDGGTVTVRGRVRPGGGRRVKLLARGPGGELLAVHTRRDGRFSAHLGLSRPGAYRVRAFAAHAGRSRAARSVSRGVTVFRPAGASYYGPGLYGNGVACGGTLWPDTLGVANKTLPCGTMVKLRYRGRSVTVPVIDRGPYVAGRSYDLTAATKARLGFPGVGIILASR
jgi:hypothetical protein